MKRYVKASADENVIATKMSELQSASNELVDSILALIDELPKILEHVAEYDAENAKYGDSLGEELPQSLEYIINDIKSATRDVENISGYYTH